MSLGYSMGMQNTSHGEALNALQVSYGKRLVEIGAFSEVPFTAILSGMRSQPINTVKWSWNWSKEAERQCKLAMNLPAGQPGQAQTVTVDSNFLINKNDVLRSSATNEHIFVVDKLGDTALVVLRGNGMDGAPAAATGTTLYVIGNSFEEGSMRPTGRVYGESEAFNQIQLFRNGWALTETMRLHAIKAGRLEDEVKQNKRKAAIDHAKDMERALLFGEASYSAYNGRPRRTMDGVLAQMRRYAPENEKNIPPSVSLHQMEDILTPLFQFQSSGGLSGKRIGFCSRHVRKFFNRLGGTQGQLQITKETNSMGMDFDTLDLVGGSIQLKVHPLFDMQEDFQDALLLIDPSAMTQMLYRPTSVDTYDRNDSNGIDATGGSYITEMGLQVDQPYTTALLKGFCEVSCETCVPSSPIWQNATFKLNKTLFDAGQDVVVTIANGKPSTTVQVSTPLGVTGVALDANGNGSLTFQAPATGKYIVSINPTAADRSVVYTPMTHMFEVTGLQRVHSGAIGVVFGEPAFGEGVTNPTPIGEGVTLAQVKAADNASGGKV